VIFKMVRNFRKWNFDRWIRGLRVHIGDVLACVEKAHAAGFGYPMRVFLTAERRERGFLREEFQIAEFIDIDPQASWCGREQEMLANVIRAHEFGVCWGGDPLNIVVDRAGMLRGIDIYRGKATWLERGKDLARFVEEGVTLPRFFLNVAVARLQSALKNRGKKPAQVFYRK